MLVEKIYLLNSMTRIGTESFISPRGHSTVVTGLRAFVDTKKRCNILLSYQLPASWGFPFLAVLSASSLGTSLLEYRLQFILEGEKGFVPTQVQTVRPL